MAEVLFESVTLTVNVEVVPMADAAGVPEMIPVPAVRVNPAGRAPEATVQV